MGTNEEMPMDDVFNPWNEGPIKANTMKQMKFYGVFFEGDKKMWVRLTGVSDEHPDGTGWTLVDKFDRFCILEEDQATGFLMKPGTDERYTKKTFKIAVS